MSSNYFQMLPFGFVNRKALPDTSLFLKNSPALSGWTFCYSVVRSFLFVISNAFNYVVLGPVISAVRTWRGWLVASSLETVLNLKAHNHGITQDTWWEKVLIHTCMLLD